MSNFCPGRALTRQKDIRNKKANLFRMGRRIELIPQNNNTSVRKEMELDRWNAYNTSVIQNSCILIIKLKITSI
jgi:hypothetical protein